MNKIRTLPRIAFWTVCGATLIAFCLRSIAFLTNYDATVGYFNSPAVTILYRILCVCAVLIPAVCVLLIPAGQSRPLHIGAQRDPLATIPLAATLWLFISFFIYYVLGQTTLIGVSCTVLTLCAVLYYAMLLCGYGQRSLRGFLGMCTAVVCVLIIGLTYNDSYVTMNSPIKLTIQFACAGIMLGVTAELRMLLDKPAPRLAVVLLGCASFFCLAGAIPCLIARFAGVIASARPEASQLYLSYLFFATLMGIYMLIRLAQLVYAPASECVSDMATASNTAPGESEPGSDNKAQD